MIAAQYKMASICNILFENLANTFHLNLQEIIAMTLSHIEPETKHQKRVCDFYISIYRSSYDTYVIRMFVAISLICITSAPNILMASCFIKPSVLCELHEIRQQSYFRRVVAK